MKTEIEKLVENMTPEQCEVFIREYSKYSQARNAYPLAYITLTEPQRAAAQLPQTVTAMYGAKLAKLDDRQARAGAQVPFCT